MLHELDLCRSNLLTMIVVCCLPAVPGCLQAAGAAASAGRRGLGKRCDPAAQAAARSGPQAAPDETHGSAGGDAVWLLVLAGPWACTVAGFRAF